MDLNHLKYLLVLSSLSWICGCGQTVILKKAVSFSPEIDPYAKRIVVSTLKFPGDIPNITNLPVGFPTKLSETGLFSDLQTLKPSPGIIEYTVQVPLWSDGAVKRRFIALPGDSKIDFQEKENWEFPKGTVLVKHFEMQISPTKMKRLETRVLISFQSRWAGFTYKWKSDESDADLIVGRVVENLTIETASQPRLQKYVFPARSECVSCHSAATGSVLGVHTRQLNHSLTLKTPMENQLKVWNRLGFFSKELGDPSRFLSYPKISDTNAPIESRARAYLAENCSICHRPGAYAPIFDVRRDVATSMAGLVGESTTSGMSTLFAADFEILDPKRIEARQSTKSILSLRMGVRGDYRMPPDFSTEIDLEALSVIRQWIDGL